MKVQEILDAKGNAQVYTMPACASVFDLVKCASERKIGALIVTGPEGEVAGIVSERDVVRSLAEGLDIHKTTVGQIMTRDLVSVGPNDDMDAAMDRMITRRIRHLPILDGKKVLGLITIRDLIFAMRKADEDGIRYFLDYLQNTDTAAG
jgi:CBS domain-containing protein